MGCTSCGSGTSIMPGARTLARRSAVQAIASEDCPYTNEILQIWYDKLKNFKTKALYKTYKVKASRLNRYLGITLTALNVSNKCFDMDMLNEISEFVTYITGLE